MDGWVLAIKIVRDAGPYLDVRCSSLARSSRIKPAVPQSINQQPVNQSASQVSQSFSTPIPC